MRTRPAFVYNSLCTQTAGLQKKGLQRAQIICLPFFVIITLKRLCMPAKKLFENLWCITDKVLDTHAGFGKKAKVVLRKVFSRRKKHIPATAANSLELF